MIVFTTENSKYRVMVLHGKFHVTKIEAIDPNSTYFAVGQTRTASRMRIEVGDRASFGDFSTSPVVSIEDSPPLPKEPGAHGY